MSNMNMNAFVLHRADGILKFIYDQHDCYAAAIVVLFVL